MSKRPSELLRIQIGDATIGKKPGPIQRRLVLYPCFISANQQATPERHIVTLEVATTALLPREQHGLVLTLSPRYAEFATAHFCRSCGQQICLCNTHSGL